MAVFPLPSVTVQVTVVVPNGNKAGASFVTLATVQLSLVMGGVKITPEAVHKPGSTFTETGPEQVIVGLILSVTITS